MQEQHIILLAHGSRDPSWCATFENGLVEIEKCLPSTPSLAYLEMAGPDLETVVARQFHQGVKDFVVIPLFFAEGRHLLHDVPDRIESLGKKFQGLQITLSRAVGRLPDFWTLLGDMLAREFTHLRS